VEDIIIMYIGHTFDNCFELRLYLNDIDRIFFAERIQKPSKENLPKSSFTKQKESERYIHEGVSISENCWAFYGMVNEVEMQYRELKTMLSNVVRGGCLCED